MKPALLFAAALLTLPVTLAHADDQGGFKKEATPPAPHNIEDGYRGTEDERMMTVKFVKTMHNDASVTVRGNLIEQKGQDHYLFRDKSDTIDVVIPKAVFKDREVKPDQIIIISGTLSKAGKHPVITVSQLDK